MGRLVEPVATYESQDCGPHPTMGTPNGNCVLWCNFEEGGHTEPLLYINLNKALLDMPKKLLENGAMECVVNHKSEDGEYLDVWVLRREHHLHKNHPFDWSKLWKWFCFRK